MRSFVPAIYDVTVALPKTSPAPTMLRIFKGQSSVVSLIKVIIQILVSVSIFVAIICKLEFLRRLHSVSHDLPNLLFPLHLKFIRVRCEYIYACY